KIYKKWLGTVMRSLECFRRIHNLEESVLLFQTGQIRDSLTGFYNYNGFVDKAVSMLACVPNQGYYIDMIALDFCGINEVFEHYSISEGNQAVIDFSRMLEIAVGKGVSCALGNGEFLIAYFYNEKCESCVEDIQEYMSKALEDYNMENGLGKLYISVGSVQRQIVDVTGFEKLINEAVGNKNNNKTNAQRHSHDKLTREERDEAQFVADILDNNRFIYYFQPIVEAESGKIYAYEALMRADIEQYISPLQILKYAEHLGRLYDVEQATFTNVLKYLEENEDVFVGKKIFINSIPGNRLREEDNSFVWDRLEHYHNSVVVELTEQAELDDKELASLKGLYKRLEIETAVDDYGTGYSNVTNLLRYMPNYVKIDRMLLAGIHLSPQKQHFVKEIIEFAHDNQIKALAEGVETAEELKMVIALGADLIQGYYTARPSAQVLSGIDSSLQNEIIQYRHAAAKQNGKKVYEAGQESRISLVKLVTGDYSRIQFNSGDVTHRDVTIVGIPGFEAEMDIVVEDSYVGRIELMDVYLKGQKKAPGIIIGNHCDVTLALNGESVIEQGGVLVPESSKLTVQGDGNLIMKQIAVDGCGIGNTKDEKHGELVFDQDGAIEVHGNTMYGVGIGSGQGGKIQINRGRYVINLSGQDAVGIGSLYADCSPVIHRGDIEIHMVNVSGVGIGSLTGSVSLEMRKTSVVGYFGGHKCTGIGTLEGEHCTLDIQDAIVNMDMRVDESCGIGSQTGETDIEMDHFRLQAAVKGKEAVSLGNFAKTAKICLRQGDISSDVKNNLEIDVGADVFEIIGTRCQFKHNGEEIVRESIDEDE
ncbi:MAG: GGDEF domain-containing protein, partial [Lachnospiraceae bacterium]|nr:GGDEF domain-containing protein [Lachnospiraceae bacterium]